MLLLDITGRSNYFLYFDVAINAIPTINKLILTGTGISFSKKNKTALAKQNAIPPKSLAVFLFMMVVMDFSFLILSLTW